MGLLDFFKKKKVELTEDQRKWNKMWDLWVEKKADSPFAQLMTYHSEVNNGGHGQYFSNVENIGDLQKEMSVLVTILPEKHKNNLEKAYKADLILEEKEDKYAEKIMEQCDDMFFDNEEELIRILKEYAAKLEL